LGNVNETAIELIINSFYFSKAYYLKKKIL